MMVAKVNALGILCAENSRSMLALLLIAAIFGVATGQQNPSTDGPTSGAEFYTAAQAEINPLRETDSAEDQVAAVAPSSKTATAKRTAIEKTHQPELRRDAGVTAESEPETDDPKGTSTETAGSETSGTEAAETEGTAPNTEPLASEPIVSGPIEANKLPTVAELRTSIDEIAKNESLDEKQRETLTSLYKQSIDWINKTAEIEQKLVANQTQTENVPQQIQSLKEKLRTTSAEPPPVDTLELATATIAQRVQELADELQQRRQQLEANQKRAEELQTNRKLSQERLQNISEKRVDVERQLDAKPSADISAQQQRATSIELRTHLKMLDARKRLLNAESKLARAMTDVHPLRDDLDLRLISRVESLHKQFSDALTERQETELRQRIEEARKEARAADPDLRELASHNLELAELRSKYNALMRDATAELNTIQQQFAEQEKSFLSIQKKVEKIGMTEAIGVLLRGQATELLDDRPISIRAKQIDKELPHVELSRITAKEERNATSDIEPIIDRYVVLLVDRFPEDDARQMVRDLLETRRDHLWKLQGEFRAYQDTLHDLQLALKNTAKVTREHRRYIDEHVLWIRSSDPISMQDVTQSRLGLATLFNVSKWQSVVTDVGHAIQDRMFLSLCSFAGLVVALVLVDRLKDRITEVGKSKKVQAGYRFAPTIEVALESALLASILPAICWFASWCILLSTANDPSGDMTYAIGVGLKWTSVTWLALSLLQQVVRPHGLGECHFGWHERNLQVVRLNLQLLLLFGLPAVFFVMLIGSFEKGRWASSLGRLSFMCGMGVMALFMHRLLNPYRATGGVWAKREVWLYKVRYLLHATCVAMPLSLTVVAAIGYGYSAYQLAYRAHLSLWLVLGIVIAHAMTARYFTIARKHAAVRQMQRKRQEAEENDSEIPVDEEIDFQAIGHQVQHLLRGTAAAVCVLGATLIWADMVPALMMLDEFGLWTTTQMVTEKLEDGSGTIRTSPQMIWITLADLLLSLSAFVATIMAARNIPGLLNVTILERLPIDYGTRYAMTAVSRYIISLIGIVTAFYLVGVTWGSVQWLVAAMTVGLGFGLQEIFANFVSGLIILMERPIRVGDIVTVGGVMGKVTRVQIRATTITDFDRRELVVPNKRFITEDVINWTLSDPITRLVLPVGIAYECDPQIGRERLLEVASRHPLVLKEPEPTAVFMGFGDSTLDLELRVFMTGRDQAFQVRDELNLAINTAFKEAKLEIAFPQRDLHIKSVDAGALFGGAAAQKTPSNPESERKAA